MPLVQLTLSCAAVVCTCLELKSPVLSTHDVIRYFLLGHVLCSHTQHKQNHYSWCVYHFLFEQQACQSVALPSRQCYKWVHNFCCVCFRLKLCIAGRIYWFVVFGVFWVHQRGQSVFFCYSSRLVLISGLDFPPAGLQAYHFPSCVLCFQSQTIRPSWYWLDWTRRIHSKKKKAIYWPFI